MSHAGRQRYLEELSSALFHCQSPPPSPSMRRPASPAQGPRQPADRALSSAVILPLLPTPEELNTKQQVRVLIEKLIRTVEPNCRLLRFGSTVSPSVLPLVQR